MSASSPEKKHTRSKVITYKVSPEELDSIKAHAEKAGIPVAEYARDISLRGQAENDDPARIRLEKTTEAVQALSKQQQEMARQFENMVRLLADLVARGQA